MGSLLPFWSSQQVLWWWCAKRHRAQTMHLPDELWCRVALYLDGPSLASFRAVCRAWRDAVRFSRRVFDLPRTRVTGDLVRYIGAHKQVGSVDMSCCRVVARSEFELQREQLVGDTAHSARVVACATGGGNLLTDPQPGEFLWQIVVTVFFALLGVIKNCSASSRTFVHWAT